MGPKYQTSPASTRPNPYCTAPPSHLLGGVCRIRCRHKPLQQLLQATQQGQRIRHAPLGHWTIGGPGRHYELGAMCGSVLGCCMRRHIHGVNTTASPPSNPGRAPAASTCDRSPCAAHVRPSRKTCRRSCTPCPPNVHPHPHLPHPHHPSTLATWPHPPSASKQPRRRLPRRPAAAWAWLLRPPAATAPLQPTPPSARTPHRPCCGERHRHSEWGWDGKGTGTMAVTDCCNTTAAATLGHATLQSRRRPLFRHAMSMLQLQQQRQPPHPPHLCSSVRSCWISPSSRRTPAGGQAWNASGHFACLAWLPSECGGMAWHGRVCRAVVKQGWTISADYGVTWHA